MQLSDSHVFTLIRAGILLQTRSRSVVSEFEVETLSAVAERFRAFGRSAVVTDPEWQVIEDAVGAMDAALVARLPCQSAVRVAG